MSFRLAFISLYFWFTFDSACKINKFETIINLIASFTINIIPSFYSYMYHN